jgi:LysR family transcriptional activator of mexEF-oprN operon
MSSEHILKDGLLGEFDLNLLLTFALLYRECSVSRAARCLHVGQPAVSNALAKLRRYFDDPLFIRSYRRMLPTPKAVKLADAIFPVLQDVQKLLV